jgi:Flp pilus assembly protein TadG
MRIWKEQGGQALVMAALLSTLLFAFMALAVDVGMLFRAKRNVQIAADAAAVAAALDYKYNASQSSAYNAAYAATAANGYTRGSGGVVVNANIAPIDGPNMNCSSCAEVQVGVPNPTTFMKLFGFGSIDVTARAVARNDGKLHVSAGHDGRGLR